MSKVLVDRELLERCVDRWACCAIVETPGAEQAWLELRAVVKAAQPAEAEGVEAVAWLHRQGNHTEAADRPLTEDEEARGWEQDELLTVTQHLAALSAVTAERDRLREALGDKALCAAYAERQKLLAEVESMRKVIRAALYYVPEHKHDLRKIMSAAMAAKEA